MIYRVLCPMLLLALVLGGCGSESDGGGGVDPSAAELTRPLAAQLLAEHFESARAEPLTAFAATPCVGAGRIWERAEVEAVDASFNRLVERGFVIDSYQVLDPLVGGPLVEFRPSAEGEHYLVTYGGVIDVLAACHGRVIEVSGIVSSPDGITALAEYAWETEPTDVFSELVDVLDDGPIKNAGAGETCGDVAPFVRFDDGWRLAAQNFVIECGELPS